MGLLLQVRRNRIISQREIKIHTAMANSLVIIMLSSSGVMASEFIINQRSRKICSRRFLLLMSYDVSLKFGISDNLAWFFLSRWSSNTFKILHPLTGRFKLSTKPSLIISRWQQALDTKSGPLCMRSLGHSDTIHLFFCFVVFQPWNTALFVTKKFALNCNLVTLWKNRQRKFRLQGIII